MGEQNNPAGVALAALEARVQHLENLLRGQDAGMVTQALHVKGAAQITGALTAASDAQIAGALSAAGGVAGQNSSGPGVQGMGTGEGHAGVQGESQQYNGVLGITTADAASGVAGVGETGNSNGIYGRSKNGNGVVGYSTGTGSGVAGANDDGTGFGVYGRSQRGTGVYGHSTQATGISGESQAGEGVRGTSHNADHGGVVGVNDHPQGTGVYGKGTRLAGAFDGKVHITGLLTGGNGGDCAEDFEIAGAVPVEPGTVMVLNDDGTLQPSARAYDGRVAGVLSGAGGNQPAIVINRQPGQSHHLPVALIGKVFCWADATYAPIEVGDLLTTSDTPGHAMKASDPVSAFGAVIGKALGPLQQGQGLVPVLVALQ